MAVGPETALYTLMGDPVRHSLSPLIHNTAFGALSVDAVYVATRVRAERLADAVRGLDALGFSGANVTIPHKLAVMELLDDVTETARTIGAVNTIRVDRSGDGPRLAGDNTDAAGFASPLLDASRDAPDSALVLGAGGSARAVVYACLELIGVSKLTVTTRREEQAIALAGRFSDVDAEVGAVPWSDRSAAAADALLIVNCTPLGMRPATGDTPLEDLSHVGAGQTVYDLVYAPAETRLLAESAARGARTISGMDMLIGQAAEAFRWWTGREMPLDRVRDAVKQRVEAS